MSADPKLPITEAAAEQHQLNSLAKASSAYLRSAMHQPIRWHQWGEEAFAAARRENKPVLLDIGAVWCHWCHVMDRESYDSPEVAEIINQNFIAVKVDRDERPDVDSRYQAAIQAISGQGGWPLTAFLTPEGKPFYGGTYFPPEDHWGRPGFKRVLSAIAAAYREKHGEVQESAESVMNAISQAESFAGRAGQVPADIAEKLVESAVAIFDARNGGFGQAPKFPHPSALDLIAERYARTGSDELRSVLVTTLKKMAMGGVYDQLAGGFHRYSVDERWIVPHFEKMSYDNSELLKNYVHAWQATGDEFFARVARDIIRWMDEWLSDRERGGFYASQDADIDLDDDGNYFTWTVEEARAAMSPEEAEVALLHYDISEVGEMHHDPRRNVLYQRAPVAEIAVRLGKPVPYVEQMLQSAKKKMYAVRLQRPTPYVDRTVYVGWNAMCVSAYLLAARVLNASPDGPLAKPAADAELRGARDFGLRTLDRLLRQGRDGQRGLAHVIAYSDADAELRHVPGMLDDYAFLAIACLDAYESTSDTTYFRAAREIADEMIERFYDATGGGFFDSPADGEALGALAARRKPFQDSPTPAGNPAAAIALLRLHAYTNEAGYHERAEDTLEVFAGIAERFGMFAATYGIAATLLLEPHVQVVVVGDSEPLYRAAVTPLAFNKTVLRLSWGQMTPENLPPALAATLPNLPNLKSGEPFAVICSGFACQPPVSDAAELTRRLQEALSAAG